jgi:hypothetical protein
MKTVSAMIVAAWHCASFSLCRQAEAVGAEHFHCRFRALRWKSYVRRRPLLLARVDERPCFFLPLQRRRFGIARTARAARPAAAGQAPVRVRLLFPGERERERERRRAAPLAAQERRGFAPTMPVVHFLSAASCVPAASIGLLHLIGGERISGFLNPRKDRSRRVLRESLFF